jgi:hypothetical protein
VTTVVFDCPKLPRSGKRVYKTKAIRFAFSGAASLVLIGVSLLSLAACGGNSSSSGAGSPPGTSTMVVTAKSGTLSHSTNIILTIK